MLKGCDVWIHSEREIRVYDELLKPTYSDDLDFLPFRFVVYSVIP
jgi:hypothetical protein